jgi:outer membrane protein OmpA-like peptidoglycan-associated protein
MLLVILALAGLAMGASAQSGKSIIINHLICDPAIIEGHLVVSDVEGTGGTVTIKIYDENGTLAGQGTESIPANGKINVTPEKYVQGKLIGTARISSSKVIAGQYWQFYKDARKLGWKNVAVPAQAAPGSTKLVCQHFVSDPGTIESYIVVADGDGRGSTVYVDLYSDNGELAGQKVVTIPANGKVRLVPSELVGNKKMTGVAYLQTEGSHITGEYWQVEEGKKYQLAHAIQGSAQDAASLASSDVMRIMINFDFDSDKIQKRSFADLAEVAKAMNKNKKAKYEVGGYTDNVGKAEYNQKLAERRATAVKNWLVKNGKVTAKRLVVKGYGPANPIADNDDAAGQARNRRVEFKKL